MKNLSTISKSRKLKQGAAFFILSLNLITYNNCGGGFYATQEFSSESGVLKSSFQCEDQNLSSKSGSHFLSKKQYINTLEDLFGVAVVNEVASELSSLQNDNFDEESRNKISTLDANTIQSYHNAATEVSNKVVDNTTRRANVFGSCANQTALTSTCINTFMNNFGLRVLRRPLMTTETAFINSILAGAGTNSEKLKAMLGYLLQSPYFIWRIELGDSTNTTTSFNLTDYESATRLSFALTDSTPDVTLLDAVKNGQFKTDEEYKAQAFRLIETAKGKAKVIDLIQHWSLSENPQDLSGLPAALKTGLNLSGIEQAMVTEVRQFIDHIVFKTPGTFQDLLKSKLSFATHTGLASIYNHAPATLMAPAEMTERRQGVLMRAPFMTWSGPRTNLIKRGVEFQKRVLCNQIPSPNVDIADDRDAESFTPAEMLENSNRENVAHQTRGPVCMGCHSAINPVGFAFESFDSLGRLRPREQIFDMGDNFYKYINIDSSTFLMTPDNKRYPIQDAYDLATYVADSSEGNECFVRNVHRYLAENPESNSDGCHLNSAFNNLANTKLPIKDVVIDIVLTNNLKRKIAN